VPFPPGTYAVVLTGNLAMAGYEDVSYEYEFEIEVTLDQNGPPPEPVGPECAGATLSTNGATLASPINHLWGAVDTVTDPFAPFLVENIPSACTDDLIIYYQADLTNGEQWPSELVFDANTRTFTISKCPDGPSTVGDADCASWSGDIADAVQIRYSVTITATLAIDNGVDPPPTNRDLSTTITIGPDCTQDFVWVAN
jgi:hypothetical protein